MANSEYTPVYVLLSAISLVHSYMVVCGVFVSLQFLCILFSVLLQICDTVIFKIFAWINIYFHDNLCTGENVTENQIYRGLLLDTLIFLRQMYAPYSY